MKKKEPVGFVDRAISCLSYLTAGWLGLAVFLVMNLKKKRMSSFLRFNLLQSMLFGILVSVIAFGLNLLTGFLKFIPFINYLIAQIGFLLNRPIFFNWSVIQTILLGLTLYMMILSAFGIKPRIYYISKIIDYNTRF